MLRPRHCGVDEHPTRASEDRLNLRLTLNFNWRNHMNHEVQIEINDLNDLNDVAVDLTEEELQAVAGAMMSVSWKCGSSHLADEWNV